METFSALPAICAGNKGQWRGALTFSLICTWKNGLVNNRVSTPNILRKILLREITVVIIVVIVIIIIIIIITIIIIIIIVIIIILLIVIIIAIIIIIIIIIIIVLFPGGLYYSSIASVFVDLRYVTVELSIKPISGIYPGNLIPHYARQPLPFFLARDRISICYTCQLEKYRNKFHEIIVFKNIIFIRSIYWCILQKYDWNIITHLIEMAVK